MRTPVEKDNWAYPSSIYFSASAALVLSLGLCKALCQPEGPEPLFPLGLFNRAFLLSLPLAKILVSNRLLA